MRIFGNRDNMMGVKLYARTAPLVVAISALLASPVVALPHGTTQGLPCCGIDRTSPASAPVPVVGTGFDPVTVLVLSEPLVPGHLPLLGPQPLLSDLSVGSEKGVHVVPVVVGLVADLKAHAQKCGALLLGKAFVPCGQGMHLLAVRVVSPDVLRVSDAPSFGSRTINSEGSEFGPAATSADLKFPFDLCLGYRHEQDLTTKATHTQAKRKCRKGSELLGTPESLNRYNVAGNGEREGVKSVEDWAISSQAAQEWVEGSTTRAWSPDRTVKPHECSPRKGRYSLVCGESRRAFINSWPKRSQPYSGKLEALSQFDVRKTVMTALQNDAAKVLDSAAFAQFAATEIRVVGVGSGANSYTYDGTATASNTSALYKANVTNIRDTMAERNIPFYDGDSYVCLAHPSTLRAIKDELVSVNQYTETGYTKIINGEIGKFDNVRFVEQTNIAKGAVSPAGTYSTGLAGTNGAQFIGAKSNWALFFGSDTVMEGIAIPEETRAKIPCFADNYVGCLAAA
jgi:hypothetical protein